jgi:hypothetical protein
MIKFINIIKKSIFKLELISIENKKYVRKIINKELIYITTKNIINLISYKRLILFKHLFFFKINF